MKYAIVKSYDDIPAICLVFKAFVQEVGWNLTFNQINSKNTLENYIDDSNSDVIIAFNDKLVGVALVSSCAEFSNEPDGYISKFYVIKESRGTDVARNLLKKSIEWFQERAIKTIFASDTALINPGLFNNLLKKKGFRPIGDVMVMS